jgi:methylglutaconyl-CoA hydratase
MPTTEATLYDVEGGAAWITLNRPENRNALSQILVTELDGHIAAANDDLNVRCMVITGAGSAFCAGADLKNQDRQGEPTGPTFPQVLKRILDSPKPVIAAVNGAAFAGGLGLVGASDIVVAVEDAQFSFSEVRIGVIPAIIAVVCVPKLGTHHAMKLFLTGQRFTGVRATEFGLVHRAVAKERLRAAVQEEIDMICLGAPSAVSECKKLVRRAAQQLPVDDALREMEQWSRRMFTSADGQEGMAAFREKRPPSWVRKS